jgi:hypothetical protein
MTFRVGQKVVFVGGPRLPGEWGIPSPLKIGSIYTIREIDPIYIGSYGVAGIRLHEMIAPSVMWGAQQIEPATLAHNFRPIVDRKTDISVFTKMLTPEGVDA